MSAAATLPPLVLRTSDPISQGSSEESTEQQERQKQHNNDTASSARHALHMPPTMLEIASRAKIAASMRRSGAGKDLVRGID